MSGRAVALLVGALSVSGCGRLRDCQPGTLLVNVWLPSTSFGLTSVTLGVDVTIDGVRRENRFDLAPTADTVPIEISFPSGYPTGGQVAVRATAADGARLLGEATGGIKMDPECGVLPLSMHAPNPDSAAD